MRRLVTVTGCVPEDQVGFCQCHEHLFISRGKSFEVDPTLLMDSYEKSRSEVERYRAAGGGTIVDAQPVGCNRMPEELLRVSQETGVHVLASTGFHKMVYYPAGHWIFTAKETVLSDIFTRELTEGMYLDCDASFPIRQSDIRAGLIKAALDCEGLTPQYEKLFSSAVNAAKGTGRTMMVHIEKGSDPKTLLRFLISRGMEPERIVLCHTDKACDSINEMKALLSFGVYLELDLIGRHKYHSDECEAEIFQELVKAGYEDRLLFALDATSARMKSYTSNAIGLNYLINSFLPILREAGIQETAIQRFSHYNCVRAFGTCS